VLYDFLSLIHPINFISLVSAIKVNLISSKNEYLKKCQEKINDHLKRSMVKIKIDEFKDWNQYVINAFYKYCNDICVLPKLENDQQVRLIGPINNVYEARQKYQLTAALIQEKIHVQQLLLTSPRRRSTARTEIADSASIIPSSICYSIMLIYCQEDSVISHRLANRFIDEGFSVWIDSIESKDIFSQINKSECIILCISDNYFGNELCENGAKYAIQIGKHVIPVKVQNCMSIDWLQQLIPDELYFQLFGSDYHFDLQYDKLLLKLVSIRSFLLLIWNKVKSTLRLSGLPLELVSFEALMKYQSLTRVTKN
jgi:hypothetical protein